MKNLILIFKGFIIGIAKILPGVSGAVLAISLGIYEKILNIIAHPFNIKLKDLKFLFLLLIGAAGGIIIFSAGIKWCLSNYYLPTILLFTGFIIGGMPEVLLEVKKEKNIINIFIFIFSILLIVILTNLTSSSQSPNNHYFMMGIIESLTTIIPGISGTAIFMALGWYENLLSTLNSILTFTAPIKVSFYFIFGFILATILIARILNYLFKKHKIKSYYGVLGFLIGSLFTMFKDLIHKGSSVNEIIIGLMLLIIGFFSTIKINNFFSKF